MPTSYAHREAEAYREVAAIGERDFVERVQKLLPAPPPMQVWAGDDTAVLEGGRLFAADTLVAGVHFDLAWCEPADAGWKSLAVNLSDISAMGGEPEAAVIGLVLPGDSDRLGDGVMEGLAEAAAEFDCPIVGGDTTVGPELVISVAVIGAAPLEGAVLRSGARPGDTVFVTGVLGGPHQALNALRGAGDPAPSSLAWLRRPTPRLTEGRTAAAAMATAMIDLSDGLGVDLEHLCSASGVGIRVEASEVPLADAAGIDDALVGGDEYELCFTAPDRGLVVEAFDAAALERPTPIGTVTEVLERVLVVADGTERPFEAVGWEHPVS